MASDADSDLLSFAIQAVPDHGEASIVNSILFYTPGSAHMGNDLLIYSVSDGKGATAQATIIITVTLSPTTLVSNSPANGEGNVAGTRETIIQFGQPIKIIGNIADSSGT